ncbi:hypothetical protein ACVTEI_19105 (plasmid) [Vibrio cholerae]|uniref:hypothetical protein n=1 Tax=Vibrio TaxID=662 RepID=UPI000A60AB47|nr:MULTISPECIES: hypothetical protein [Vibrio]MDV2319035.1 hypothetical protein [Vibrio cholerae]HDZ9328845.1 hypothetical protein [Vibrio cholerae]HDZ9681531.1 hypothetical protein [Vibrio cholerae]
MKKLSIEIVALFIEIVALLIGAVIWNSFTESNTRLFDIFMSVLIGYGLLLLFRHFKG